MFFGKKEPIKARLYAPQDYIAASPETRAAVCNGCGMFGKSAGRVPDRLLGVPIQEACHIHDWMFTFSEAHYGDKAEADRVFLDNMMRLIFAHSGSGFLTFLRVLLAIFYYQVESHAGGVAFWEDKLEPEEMIEIEIG